MTTWKPVAGITTLRKQVDERWPKRDKRSDGIVGDLAHQGRPSDHNPDSRGYVHALDLDEDFRGSENDNRWYAEQLIAYARTKRSGYQRLKNVVYENRVASGTYADHNWTWRDGDYGHTRHIHTSFTTKGESDGSEFDIPILYGKAGLWDGAVPFYDILKNASVTGEKNKATWRLACRLAELGFFEGPVQPLGKQGYPVKAIYNMQDYMGWKRREYDPKVHRAIWRKLKLSENTDNA